MGKMNKLVFRGENGKAYIELHDDNTFVQYVINDPDEAFSTLRIVADCLEADLEAKGITFDEDYYIVCEGTCADMMEKFKESQLRAIIRVLYSHDLPSDLDVLAQELQLRMGGQIDEDDQF